MNIRGKEVKVDKLILAEAIGLTLISWVALIPIYLLLLERKKRNGRKQDTGESVGEVVS